jgi:hypothetical protein
LPGKASQQDNVSLEEQRGMPLQVTARRAHHLRRRAITHAFGMCSALP